MRRGVYKKNRWEVDAATGCHNWLLATNKKTGYGVEHNSATGQMSYAHIVAWEAIHGPVPPGKELHHKCRNHRCRNPKHLRALTRRQHIALGRIYRIPPGKQSRLSSTDVNSMRELRARGWSLDDLARVFSVATSWVSLIVRGLKQPKKLRGVSRVA